MHGIRWVLQGPGKILVPMIFLVIAACGERDRTPTSVLQVHDLNLRSHPGGARILSGVVENTSDEDIPVAQLQVSLFDADNIAVSTMSVVVNRIPSQGSVPFREAVDSDLDIQGARLRHIILP